MRAVLLTGHGGPEKLEYRHDVPVPRPAAGKVLVEVGACGINNTDLWTREAAYGSETDSHAVSSWQALHFPRIQGADIVGRVAAVGEGISPARLGERVRVDPWLYSGGDDALLDTDFMGSERDRGFAEYCTVPAANARRIESPLSDAELATFPTAYLTAEHMLNRARLAAGETILISGASGGVGSALVQLARLRGARTVAIVLLAKCTVLALSPLPCRFKTVMLVMSTSVTRRSHNSEARTPVSRKKMMMARSHSSVGRVFVVPDGCCLLS